MRRKSTKTIVKKNRSKYNARYLIRAFELARMGESNEAICNALGISKAAFGNWMKKFPSLRWALKRARKNVAGMTMEKYIFSRLPPKLQKLWEKINQWRDNPTAAGKIDALLDTQGKRVRQHLFLHALVNGNYNPTKACQAVGITTRTFKYWQDDPDFKELLDEIIWHQGNFGEEALWKLVQKGEPSIVKFYNQTKNKDRGYVEKTVVEGNIQHQHVIVLDQLDLPLHIKKIILKAIEERDKNVIDGESRPALEDHSNEIEMSNGRSKDRSALASRAG